LQSYTEAAEMAFRKPLSKVLAEIQAGNSLLLALGIGHGYIQVNAGQRQLAAKANHD
jgi:hypothetical protein